MKASNSNTLLWAPAILSLGYLWFSLVNNLRVEWMTDPQYGYGLFVPFLCAGLLLRRLSGLRAEAVPDDAPSGNATAIAIAVFLAFLYLPTRLISAAIPEWRPVQWILGIEAVGLTLCAIRLGKGRVWLKQLAFPICFFLVAIPWPTLFEAPIIQTLTRASAVIVIGLLGWAGIPALEHGNLIEVSTGVVGIDEACSGIRSFQTSLMIGLFLGEFYRLSRPQRGLLILLGLVFSLGFNICRMFFLTVVAFEKGVPAIARFHDPAGTTIAVLCTFIIWGIALLIKRKSRPAVAASEVPGRPAAPRRSDESPDLGTARLRTNLWRFGLVLVTWIIVVEAGVQWWYRSRESHLKLGPAWTIQLPEENPTLRDLPITDATRNLLRYDEGKQASWTAADGTHWEVFYFNWLPGRVAGYLAKRHTPEICLAAMGLKQISGPHLNLLTVHGVVLPVNSYEFATDEGVIQVFHCRWEAGAAQDAYVAHESARFNLVRAIWAGRGEKGQKVFEFVISGMDDANKAMQAVENQLETMIKVGPTPDPKFSIPKG